MTKETLHLNPTSNPAEGARLAPAAHQRQRKRIPMSVPRAKMWVPQIPGHFCYWFNDYAGRVQQAQAAGYEFVQHNEVDLNPGGLANDVATSGNTDMGSQVSIVVGENAGGGPLRAYLMKIPQEWHDEDVAEIQARNDLIAEQIRRGKIGAERDETDSDKAQRYVKTHQRKDMNRR